MQCKSYTSLHLQDRVMSCSIAVHHAMSDHVVVHVTSYILHHITMITCRVHTRAHTACSKHINTVHKHNQ